MVRHPHKIININLYLKHANYKGSKFIQVKGREEGKNTKERTGLINGHLHNIVTKFALINWMTFLRCSRYRDD